MRKIIMVTLQELIDTQKKLGGEYYKDEIRDLITALERCCDEE